MSAFRSASTAPRFTAAVLIGLLLGLPATAAGPLDVPKLAEAARAGWFQSAIVSGRVVVKARRPCNEQKKSGDRTEKLTISVLRGQSQINYLSTAPEMEFSVDVTDSKRLHIRLVPKGDSDLAALEFDQPAEGPLSLVVGAGERAAVYRAASLWHLLIVRPKVSAQTLVPLLEPLGRDWNLAREAADLEAALLRTATTGWHLKRLRWATLIRQLGDDRYARREAADRQLRTAGRALATYLERLDPGLLDAEQQYRIHRILRTLDKHDSPDTPGQVAAWLSGDPLIWAAMLSRDELSTRRLAAAQLGELLPEAAFFDPAADAATRRRQLERLGALIPTD